MTRPSEEIFLKDYTPPLFSVADIYLHFDLSDEKTTVRSILQLHRNPKALDQHGPLVLNGEALKLISVALDGKPLTAAEYHQDDAALTLFNVGTHFTLETVVEIEPHLNTALMGLYRSGGNYCTQCEAEGFRRITYYLDRPDVLSHFTVSISADKKRYPHLLSNGNLIESRDLPDGRHWVKWQDPSLKPCYLFALVAGHFDVLEDQFTTRSGRPITLKLYVERGFADQGEFALGALKRAMQWDEERFGREYDLDIYMIVAVSDFNMGAMENKGLNIFNTKYVLAKPETATDTDYLNIEAVIGHEYFHNWSGNRVTCRDWFQLTLKEGLTVFRDQLFTEDMSSRSVARLDVVDVVRNRQFPEDAGPLAHPIRPSSYVEINNFYTSTVYRKGAEVIRMVQTLLGEKLFRQGLDWYFEHYDGQAVTTEDFLRAMQTVSGIGLGQFQHWYDQAGTPVLTIKGQYLPEEKRFLLTVRQSCPPTPQQTEKEPFDLPLALGLIGSVSHTTLPIPNSVLRITQREEQFVFEQIEEKPIPSLLRHFSAPVRLEYPYTDAELADLVRYDTDGFCRFDALQQLSARVLLRCAEALANQEALSLDPTLESVYQYLLTGPVDDPQYLARLLALPAEGYLHTLCQSDPQAIHAAKKWVKQALAKQLATGFLNLYQQYPTATTYAYTPEQVGPRQLRGACLAFLVCTAESAYIDLAYNSTKAPTI